MGLITVSVTIENAASLTSFTEAFAASETRILAWAPDTLFLTHFGPFHGARPHFQQLMERLAHPTGALGRSGSSLRSCRWQIASQ